MQYFMKITTVSAVLFVSTMGASIAGSLATPKAEPVKVMPEVMTEEVMDAPKPSKKKFAVKKKKK